MHKFNIVWGVICLAFSIGAALFIAFAGKEPVFYALAVLPFVVGANALHLGLKEKKEIAAKAATGAK